MDPIALANAGLIALNGIVSLIGILKKSGALTDDEILAAWKKAVGEDTAMIEGILASLPAS